jgi:hypothetical protein
MEQVAAVVQEHQDQMEQQQLVDQEELAYHLL